MSFRELIQLPNLFSLSRVVLAPLIGYILWKDQPGATMVAALLIILAGVTDGLDGYLARRMKCVTRLGMALDPIADKAFAIILVICLILFRDFPIWLAAAIIGRDILIVAGGLWLKRRRDISLPSNLTGRWAFAAVAVLLGAYIIRFQFSIQLMTPIVVILLGASLIGYGLVFVRIKRGRSVEPFSDNARWRSVRYGLLTVVAAAHLVMFYVEFLE